MTVKNRSPKNTPHQKFTKDLRRIELRNIVSKLKLPLMGVLGSISLLLGIIGFQIYTEYFDNQQSTATALYLSLNLFKFGGGGLNSPIPWQLEIARWTSPAIAAYTVILGVIEVFANQLTWLRLKFLKNHVVICRSRNDISQIIRSFRDRKIQVVIIEEDGRELEQSSPRDPGIIRIKGVVQDIKILNRARVNFARYLICVTDDDAKNIQIALQVRKLCGAKKNGNLYCTVQVLDTELWGLVRHQEFAVNNEHYFKLTFVNLLDHSAKHIISELNLDVLQQLTSETQELCFMGCDTLTEHILLNAVRKFALLRGPGNNKMSIGVFDPAAETFIKSVTKKYPLIEKLCEWKIYTAAEDSFENISPIGFPINELGGKAPTFLINKNDGGYGLKSALQLAARSRKSPNRILIIASHETGIGTLLDNMPEDYFRNKIKVVDPKAKSSDIFQMFNSTLESIAEETHNQYVRKERLKGFSEKDNPALVNWNKLSEQMKNLNREQAESIGKKLAAINCEIMPWVDFDAQDFAFTQSEIDLLARMEHGRWCEQKKNQGWKYGKTRDDQKKIHPSLIDWDNGSFSEAEKDKDRNAVIGIPDFLAHAGYQIVRK